jgi:Ca-activated chloride channel family protein
VRFLWPDLLWLTLILPVLAAAYVYALRKRKRTAIAYTNLALVRAAIGPGQHLRRHLPPALLFLALTAALLATARPTAVVTLPSQFLTIILAMDVSRSMLATDVEPTRITAAQAAAKAFISDLPKNVRLGIVTFAGTASVVQTPTENREEMLAAINRFQLQRATATGSGLLLALATLFPDEGFDLQSAIYGNTFTSSGASPIERPSKKGAKKEHKPVAPGSYTGGAIILISDGRRTTGPDPVEIAKMAADYGVRVFTVGFGTLDGAMVGSESFSFYARLDEPTLKAVAAMTGAEYFYAGTAADLRKVYESLNLKFALERRETEISALFSAVAAALAIVAVLLSLFWFRRRT